LNLRINKQFNIRKGTMNFILEEVSTDKDKKEHFTIIGYFKTLDRLYNKLAAGRRITNMTYGELMVNPKNGIYKTDDDTYVIVDGAKVTHSPFRKSIKDDEILEKIELKEESSNQYVWNHVDDEE